MKNEIKIFEDHANNEANIYQEGNTNGLQFLIKPIQGGEYRVFPINGIAEISGVEIESANFVDKLSAISFAFKKMIEYRKAAAL